MKIFFILILLFNGINSYSQVGEPEDIPFVVFSGKNTVMPLLKLASYCAPVFWFSSDEPELHSKWKEDIKIPAGFPFEPKTDSPVVYYQISEIISRSSTSLNPVKINYSDINKSIIDISKVAAFTINYSHYYENEAGLGGHRHDTEQSEFKFSVRRVSVKDSASIFHIVLQRVTARAHALKWYDNIWKLDTNSTETVLPVHILVEEGKHASCTDMNADGFYTPGYDVNIRTNDAWGLRDVIRTGSLFTSEYQSYFSKLRTPEYRVFPPLPDDSPVKKWYVIDGIYAKGNAVYALRPFPEPSKVRDRLLYHDMKDYYVYNSMEIKSSDVIPDWLDDDLFIKSIGLAARYDDDDIGVSVTFPLLIVKNVEMPLVGGWIVNKMNFKDTNFRDISYTMLLTPSASRFMDPYFAIGVERDAVHDGEGKLQTTTEPILETGIKIRANVKYSFLKFLSFISEFWGFRVGIKNTGFPDINRLNYIFEFGAGVW